VKFDRGKLIAGARTQAARGQLRRAIDLFRQIVAREPNDADTWLRIAELCKRTDATAEAADAYAEGARAYRRRGFGQKAAAAFEQALRADERRYSFRLEAAALYAELGHSVDAARHFRAAADALQEGGRLRDAIGALTSLLELAPDDLALRFRIARLYADQGLHGEAMQQYMELATLYLRHGDPLRALQLLKLCYQTAPEDPDVLALMARAFGDAGRHDKVAAVLRERERILGAHRDAAPPRGLARGTSRAEPPEPVDHTIRKLFTEATSYIKVGLPGRAIPILRAILVERPEHEEARLALAHLTGES
jgi:tetratricopeptide (TPR) repeat protein